MSTQFHEAVKAILAMPYYKNEAARSGGADYGHEAAVAVRVAGAGFTEVNKDQFPKLTKAMLKKFARTCDDSEVKQALQGLPLGSYILQPSGSQGFPDVLIHDFDSRFICLECKSGKGKSPMWNDSVPNPESIYVFASSSLNETTVFLGMDVLSEEERLIHDECEAEIKLVVEKYKAKSEAADKNNRGFYQDSRKQHFQAGGKKKTNYFTHTDRSKCEANTLEYALNDQTTQASQPTP